MMEELRVRNLSEVTSRLYLGAAERFAKYFGRSPDQLGPEEVRGFFLHLLDEEKVTARTVQLYRSALKFLYVRTLRRSWFDEEVANIKQRIQLPTVLSAEEVASILDRTTNLKHWTLIATLYATGLRVSEVRRLKVSDIDSQRMLIHVRQGKGQVSRDVALSVSLLERLRVYWRRVKPQEWLFPSGQRPGVSLPRTHYPADLPQRSAEGRDQQARQSACFQAQLRHTFARGRRGPAHHSGFTRACEYSDHGPISARLNGTPENGTKSL
jgi:integrase/recombinase XerD